MPERPRGEYILQNPIEIAIAKKALELTGLNPQAAEELDLVLQLYLLMRGLGQPRSMMRMNQGEMGEQEKQDIVASLELLIDDQGISPDDRRTAQQLLHNLRNS